MENIKVRDLDVLIYLSGCAKDNFIDDISKDKFYSDRNYTKESIEEALKYIDKYFIDNDVDDIFAESEELDKMIVSENDNTNSRDVYEFLFSYGSKYKNNISLCLANEILINNIDELFDNKDFIKFIINKYNYINFEHKSLKGLVEEIYNDCLGLIPVFETKFEKVVNKYKTFTVDNILNEYFTTENDIEDIPYYEDIDLEFYNLTKYTFIPLSDSILEHILIKLVEKRDNKKSADN